MLFVDDDWMLRKLFTRAVKNLEPSWTVKKAECGEEAQEMIFGGAIQDGTKANGEQFDFIFMDQYMPVAVPPPEPILNNVGWKGRWKQ